MSFLNAATVLASQLVAVPLAHQRFLDAPRGGINLSRENFVLWVNPKGGGGRGKVIAGRYEQQLRQAGLTVHHLDPKNPQQNLNEHLRCRSTGNVFILETVPDRHERMDRLAAVFRVLGGGGKNSPIGLPMGGDGTIAEMMEAGLQSAGISTGELLRGQGTLQSFAEHSLPRIVPVKKAGSAADYAKEGNGPRKDIVSFLRHAVAVPVACAVMSPFGGKDVYLVPHTVNFGFGAEIFRRGDLTKYGWFRGSSLNYQLRIPGILGDSLWAWLVKRLMRRIPEQPMRTLVVRYQIDEGEVVEATAQDVLITGLRHVGGGLLIPHTPRDGVAVLLTHNMIGAIPATVEVKVRDVMHGVTGDQGTSALLGNRITLLEADRQLVLHPGQKFDVMLLDKEGDPTTAALQVNGQYMEDAGGMSLAVTPPYPGFLVAPESRLDQLHNPVIEAARPVVRWGLSTYLGTELVKYLATDNPAAVAVALTVGGVMASRKAPRAAVAGLLLSPIAAGVIKAANLLQDHFELSETGWGKLLRHSSSALAVYLGLAVAIRLLALSPFFRKVIAGDYRLTHSERPLRRLPQMLAYGASAVLGGLYYFLS